MSRMPVLRLASASLAVAAASLVACTPGTPRRSLQRDESLAAPAWTAMMRDVYDRRRAPATWVMPDSIVEFDIDKSTGYLATPFCPRDLVVHEFFFPGTEPTERCPVHSPFRGMK